MKTHSTTRHILKAILLIAALSSATTGSAAEKDPICGKWKWVSGAVHTFAPNGHIVGEKGCTWKRIESAKSPKYIVTWKTDYVDTLWLVNGGTELRGKNSEEQGRAQKDGRLFGTRISR